MVQCKRTEGCFMRLCVCVCVLMCVSMMAMRILHKFTCVSVEVSVSHNDPQC